MSTNTPLSGAFLVTRYHLRRIYDRAYTEGVSWSIEFSAEVAEWYAELTPSGSASADRAFDYLAAEGHLLRMPHSRSLGDGLFELRFSCEGVARRVTYEFAPVRRAILLTTFRKQRDNEKAEVRRARRVQKKGQGR